MSDGQEKRNAHRRTGWRAVVAAVLMACGFAGCVRATEPQQPSLMLRNLAVSPDGRTVAFDFRGQDRRFTGIGLYEWRTGTLTRVPNPPSMAISDPSFSHDGKRLAVAVRNLTTYASDIAVVDLSTMAIKQVTHVDPGQVRTKHDLVFQPETGAILYAEDGFGVPDHLKFVSADGNIEKTLIDPQKGFVAISAACFVKRDEVYFQGTLPHDFNALNAVKELGVSTAESVLYRLHLGDEPQFLSATLEKARTGPDNLPINSLSASRNGQAVIGIGSHPTEPKNSKGQFNSEIFRISKSFSLEQLTNLKSRLGHSSIAYDGSVVAFQSDPTRRNRFNLLILDMRTGTITETGLPGKLDGNPAFTLPLSTPPNG